VVVGRHAATDGLLQHYFVDIVRRESAFGERGTDVKAEFVPLAERDHGADHQHAPGALIEMRPGPDFAPCVARDQVDESALNEFLPAMDLSTQAPPSTLRRWAKPSSRRF
jgi:hypothetical protein